MIGWAAARGTLSIEAWVLFAIVFFWQMPHVLAISWMYREDYDARRHSRAAGRGAGRRSTASRRSATAAALVPVTLLPTSSASRAAVSSPARSCSARAAGARDPLRPATTGRRARRLFSRVAAYLPVLWVLMLADRTLAVYSIHERDDQDLPALNADAERDLRLSARGRLRTSSGASASRRIAPA